MQDELLLKWGTLKGWGIKTDAAWEAMKAYFDAGPQAAGAMQQRDDDTQKAALCAVIDAIDGTIQNDWTGEMMTKDEAKAYVMGYGK